MAGEQPKKPVGGAYGAFLNEKRAEFSKACAGQKASAISTMAGEGWKKLNDAEKAPYQRKYEAAKAKFETEMAAFLAAGGKKSKGVAGLRTEKRNAKEGKGKKAKDPDMQKKPAGCSYGAFLAENRAKIVKSLPAGHKITDVAKAARVQLKALSDADKAPYEAKYQQKKVEYAKALEEYKKGHPDASGDDEDGDEEEASPKKVSSTKVVAKKAAPKGRPKKESPKKIVAKKVAPKEASPKASEKKRAAADQGTAPAKRGRGAAKKSEPEAPTVDAAVLKEARALKLDGLLMNLMARPDVVAKGASQKQILEALKKSDGLVNKAKFALLGA